jgi:hypothetical protein
MGFSSTPLAGLAVHKHLTLTHAYHGIAPLEGNVQICPNWRVIIDFFAPLHDDISLSRIDD